MDIQFISHASVIIKSGGIKLWTDPWITGKAFNNSWSLLGSPYYSEEMLHDIDYIWISHEHPDHFNFATLESLPEEFKSRVTVLFQTQNSDRVFCELKNFGFKNFKPLTNRKRVYLSEQLYVYCFQAHFGDSCLGVSNGKELIFDINDAELSASEAKKILGELGGHIDVVLNQFSLAGYHGYMDFDKYLPVYAEEKLQRLLRNHRELKANLTIPFASFVYFSCEDNKYMNSYANSPKKVYDFLQANGVHCLFLSEGDVYRLGDKVNDNKGLEKWEDRFNNIENLDYLKPEIVPIQDIQQKAKDFSDAILDKYPKILVSFLRSMTLYIDDLKLCCNFDLKRRRFDVIDLPKEKADIFVNSQPLHYAFTYSWGFETLAEAARVLIKNNYNKFKLLKNISILYSNEIYLKPRYFFKRRNIRYIFDRLSSGLLQQIVRKSLRKRKIRH